MREFNWKWRRCTQFDSRLDATLSLRDSDLGLPNYRRHNNGELENRARLNQAWTWWNFFLLRFAVDAIIHCRFERSSGLPLLLLLPATFNEKVTQPKPIQLKVTNGLSYVDGWVCVCVWTGSEILETLLNWFFMLCNNVAYEENSSHTATMPAH